jgi:hypothetical protein
MSVGCFNELFENHGEDVKIKWRMLNIFHGQLPFDPAPVIYQRFPQITPVCPGNIFNKALPVQNLINLTSVELAWSEYSGTTVG